MNWLTSKGTIALQRGVNGVLDDGYRAEEKVFKKRLEKQLEVIENDESTNFKKGILCLRELGSFGIASDEAVEELLVKNNIALDDSKKILLLLKQEGFNKF